MMGAIIKAVAGPAGPFLAGAVAVVVVGAIGAATVQTARLSHAKTDLTAARLALKDPVTGKRWQDLAIRDAADLATCRANKVTLQGALDRQGAAVEALTEAGRASTAAANQALDAARKAASTADKSAATIMAAKPASADLCASALALIREN